MSFFSRNIWRKIWEAITPTVMAAEKGTSVEDLDIDLSRLDELCNVDSNCLPERRLSVLDVDDTGIVTVENIHNALSAILHLSVDDSGTETSLAEFVHSFADADGDGVVTLDDLNTFCSEIPEIYDNQKWRLAFPRPEKLLAS
jgi:Ca2+-binding EF-hand superfamily protein